ncbi:DNA gyrase subunit B [Terracoccus luteus]|uniref:DNA topoisomerase (ATP-hydrolyzing) n=2 Tax=Terracoccus luteus TaxID=53356 RepID=A0A495XT73_9MICO|nr:DNA gyrase subunit B [Terracoccus luteus]
MMSDRSSWATTTHEWSAHVDAQHLQDVRRLLGRPGAAGGRRHLILEVLAYADDEAATLGRSGLAIVTSHADGAVTIEDDGRGTDTRRDSDGRLVRKPVMASADVRFSDVDTAPLLPDGLPRRGISAVAALSSTLTHENHRADGAWSQTYHHGIPDGELETLRPRRGSGTVVTFTTDVTGPADLTENDRTAFPSLTVRCL